MVKLIRAFILGMIEFRRPFATKIDSFKELDAYDMGSSIMESIVRKVSRGAIK